MEKELKLKRTYTYVVGAADLSGAWKIGRADNPKNRLIGIQVGNPIELKLIAVRLDSPKLEKQLHNYFSEYHVRGEWFNLPELKRKELISIMHRQMEYVPSSNGRKVPSGAKTLGRCNKCKLNVMSYDDHKVFGKKSMAHKDCEAVKVQRSLRKRGSGY